MSLAKPSEYAIIRRGEQVIRRTDSFWQGLVLFLVFLITLGIYAVLGALWYLRGAEAPTTVSLGPGSAVPSPSGGTVQILEPVGGLATQQGTGMKVRAAVLATGFVQADLQVDGQYLGIRVNPDPQSAPWFVEWDWQNPTDGGHTLIAWAVDGRDKWLVSEPVTVTVVPRGNLLFSSNRDGAYALYAMGTDGQAVERLTQGPGSAQQPALGPGGLLAYVAETGDGRSIIRQRDAQGREMDLAAGSDPAWLPLASGQALPAEESVPTWLAYTTGVEGLSQVFVQQAPGGTGRPVTAEEVYAGQPSWSPPVRERSDALAYQRLAYVAEREGNWDIWLVAADGGEASGTAPVRLTDDPAMDWAPAWSPDGTRLAFVSDRGGGHQVYVMRADGTEVRPLTNLGQGAESPAWSPDGFWLAVVAYTGEGAGINRREIYLVRADGRDLVRLTRNAFDDTDVVWSWQP